MAERLQSGIAPGSEIETDAEKTILLDFIRDNWSMTDVGFTSDRIDWGAHPSRTTKGITLNCYRIFGNIRNKDVSSHCYYFDVPLAIDVYLRDAKAEGSKDEPSPNLIKIENYLREFILVNRMTLRSKGVNNIMLDNAVYPADRGGAESDQQKVWYHLVMQVRMVYHMFRIPV